MSHGSVGSQLGAGGELTAVEEAIVQALGGLTYSTGDVIYYSGSQLTNLGIGTSGQVLQVSSGIPAWVDAASVTSSVLTSETPAGIVNGSNTSYTVSNEPLFVIMDGMFRVSGQGYTFAGGTITVDSLIPPLDFIRSFYNS